MLASPEPRAGAVHDDGRGTEAPLLIVGGDADPNIASILARAAARGVPAQAVLVGPDRNPSVVWDVLADRLTIDGEEVRPRAAFLRYDVFGQKADPRQAVAFRAQAWHTTLHGWMLAHDDVRMVNREYAGQTNKPFMLSVAKGCGLRVPRTLITNDLALLDAVSAGESGGMIAKPVPGGGYTQPLAELLATVERRDGRSAAPAIVQERLVQPEVRIYAVGGRFIAYRVVSEALDYRNASDTRVEPFPLDSVDPALLAGLDRLVARLRMEYAAADFKTCPATGELVFLEVNSGPMFAGFDRVSDHAVSDALLDYLTR